MSVLDAASRPLLASRAECHPEGADWVVESATTVFTFRGASAELWRRLPPLLDGGHSIADIARALGSAAPSIAAVLNELNADEALVADARRAEAAGTARDFAEALKDECEFWRGEIYSKPFWNLVRSGAASRPVILGWGIEFYHFVEGANEYMAAGVANCREDAVIREWLAQHYIEECEHGRIFLKGLEQCGFSPARVKRAPPLPSTHALLNYLYEVGISDALCYAGAFAVMHSGGERLSRTDINAFYDELCTMYVYAAGMFGAFRDHALIDAELEHNRIVLDQIVDRNPDLVLRRAPQILAAARGLVEQFILFFEGIHDYYAQQRVPLPRRRLSVAEVA
jgi:hypothetical protein